jgi:flavin reductase (DIM6/NTAB) family NADH-FMN oxidoreductase RutF
MIKRINSEVYHLLHPKMTFFLTSISRKGVPNVMTCAWATPVSDEPPIVVVCVSRDSHTSALIRQTREFVINIPVKRQLEALWICGRTSGRDVDKFKEAGLRYHPGRMVRAPIIEGCIGYIECRVLRCVVAGECNAFFGEVVTAYADTRFFKRGSWVDTAEIPFHLAGRKMVYFRG